MQARLIGTGHAPRDRYTTIRSYPQADTGLPVRVRVVTLRNLLNRRLAYLRALVIDAVDWWTTPPEMRPPR